jgi:hypothetical protein
MLEAAMRGMKVCSISLVLLAAAGWLFAQQSPSNQNPSNQPNVFLDNKPKTPKGTIFRTIQGIVKDEKDNPVRSAIVQLKDTRSSKVIDFATKDDGKFVFRELSMTIDYELTAQHGDIKSAVKKVSPYDTRNSVTLTFKLEPPKPPEQ